jgi:hypothetical protein
MLSSCCTFDDVNETDATLVKMAGSRAGKVGAVLRSNREDVKIKELPLTYKAVVLAALIPPKTSNTENEMSASDTETKSTIQGTWKNSIIADWGLTMGNEFLNEQLNTFREYGAIMEAEYESLLTAIAPPDTEIPNPN